MSPAPDDRLITVPRVATIAAERGVTVKEDTILHAARRGTIDQASKHGKLWKFPPGHLTIGWRCTCWRNPYGDDKP